MHIEPLARNTLSDFVVARLKKLILNGELKEGDRLPNERELAERFEVSRSSVREGLKLLSLQGLLHRTNAGTVITANFASILEETLTLKILLDEASFEEVSEARMALETAMVELAAQRITDDELAGLQHQIDYMSDAAQRQHQDDFVMADVAFHQQIAEASQSSVMVSLYKSIIMLIFRAQTRVSYDREVMCESSRYHHRIFEALRRRNGRRARDEMSAHLIDIQDRLQHMVSMDHLRNGE